MSAPFRANRKYRVSSGKHSASSVNRPTTASSRPLTEDSYQSDFENLENSIDETTSNVFLVAENIGDKISLNSEFQLGGSLLEEDEDVIANQTRDNSGASLNGKAIVQIVSSAVLNGDNFRRKTEISNDNCYDDDEFEVFTPNGNRRTVRLTAPSTDTYGSEFETSGNGGNVLQRNRSNVTDVEEAVLEEDDNDDLNDEEVEKLMGFSGASSKPEIDVIEREDSGINKMLSFVTAARKSLSVAADHHHLNLPNYQKKEALVLKERITEDSNTVRDLQDDQKDDSTIEENTLAEFSSITFGNSSIITEEKLKNKSFKKKKRIKKVVKKKQENGSADSSILPSIKAVTPGTVGTSPKSKPSTAGTYAIPKNTANNGTNQNLQQLFPPRPRSLPASGKGGRTSPCLANSQSHLKDKVFRNSYDDVEDNNSIQSSSPLSSKLKNHNVNDRQHKRLDGLQSSSICDKSIVTSAASQQSTAHYSFKPQFSSSLQPIELYKIYQKTLKQLKECNEHNQHLQMKLDKTNVIQLVSSYQFQLQSKDEIIEKLTLEVSSLKGIIRNQERSLIQSSTEKVNEYELLDSQEKDIDVFYEQLQKVKGKLISYKEKDKEKQQMIQDYKSKLIKSQTKNRKLILINEELEKEKNHFKQLYFEKEGQSLNNTNLFEDGNRDDSSQKVSENNGIFSVKKSHDTEELSCFPLQKSMISVTNSQLNSSREAFVNEKAYLSQIKILQHDIQQLKLQLSGEENKSTQLAQELNKRELFISHQTTLLKALKQSYSELFENSQQLYHANVLIGRDTKKSPPKPPPVIVHPVKIKEKIKVKSAQLVSDDFSSTVDIETKDDGIDNVLAFLSSKNVEEKAPNAYGSLINDDNIFPVNERKDQSTTLFFITEDAENQV
jgi:hypothetical protein